MTTALAETELLTAISIPPEPAGSRSFLEVARRHGDFALVGVAAAVELDADGRMSRASLCFSNLGEVPHRPREAEALLAGKRLDDAAAIREAAETAVAHASPTSDLHASAEDRRHLAKVLVRRAFEELAANREAR